MNQLNLYLGKQLLQKISVISKREKKSISAWVRDCLTQIVDREWPKDYFKVFGALKDIERPEQLEEKNDAKRESL